MLSLREWNGHTQELTILEPEMICEAHVSHLRWGIIHYYLCITPYLWGTLTSLCDHMDTHLLLTPNYVE